MVNETSPLRRRCRSVPRTLPPSRVAVNGNVMPTPRAPGRQSEYEEEQPAGDGEPPRPAQQPDPHDDSSNSGETLTDPATGAPDP